MKNIAIAIATTAALLAAPAMAGKQRLAGEEKLAKLLEGRVAGEPERCLPMSAANDLEVIDKTALVYGRGKTIWVNRPANPRSLDDDDVLVRSSHTAQVCSLDIVRLVDRTSMMEVGTVGLGEFVPYRKVGG
ncbi:MAG: hypothetical protein FJX31_08385 [Alphaproteobacteria bacterium]|nr:hypothetical protein [Alphaproteobacteria bacterium]